VIFSASHGIHLRPTFSHRLGPLLFSADQAPHYLPGIRAVLGIYCALVVAIVAQVLVLWRSNKTRQTQRVAHGKPRFIVDTSMSAKFQQYASEEDHVLGQNGALKRELAAMLLKTSKSRANRT
jgi:uncharacterized membrane protein YraQ (UPF0718 family)